MFGYRPRQPAPPPPTPTLDERATQFAHSYTLAVFHGTGADAKTVLAQFHKYRAAYIAAESPADAAKGAAS